MDLGTLLGVLIGAATLGGSILGAVYAYGQLNERVKDNAAEIEELKGRVVKAELAATQVSGLASSIEHMGERFTDQIKHLIERIALNDDHVRTQLSDIKDEVRALKGRPTRSRAS